MTLVDKSRFGFASYYIKVTIQWVDWVCVCDAMPLPCRYEAKPDPTVVPSTKWIAGDGQAIRIRIVA